MDVKQRAAKLHELRALESRTAELRGELDADMARDSGIGDVRYCLIDMAEERKTHRREVALAIIAAVTAIVIGACIGLGAPAFWK